MHWSDPLQQKQDCMVFRTFNICIYFQRSDIQNISTGYWVSHCCLLFRMYTRLAPTFWVKAHCLAKRDYRCKQINKHNGFSCSFLFDFH